MLVERSEFHRTVSFPPHPPAARIPPSPRSRRSREEGRVRGLVGGWRRLASIECRHYVAGKPAQLLLEVVGRQTLGPMDHEVLEARRFRLDRLDAVDHLRR